jgi:peptidoglycan/LPS O-acetylase OafA/YrhL
MSTLSERPTPPSTPVTPGMVAAADPGFVPNLDALRALAVLSVMSFHFLSAKFRAPGVGWVGVWLFFVLSGFLITRNLLASARRQAFRPYLADFYRRRALRILPLYLAWVLGAGLLIWLMPTVFGRPAEWWWLLTFTENYYNWHQGGSSSFFDHLWSLSTEEQFYLVFPLVIYALPAARRNLVLALALVAMPLLRGLGAAALAQHGFSEQHVAQFSHVFPFMQWDAFIAGALLAVNEPRLQRAPASLTKRASMLGLIATIGMIALLRVTLTDSETSLKAGLIIREVTHDGYQEIWLYSLLILCCAFLLLFVYHLPATRMPLLRATNYVGRISFGMYVFHMPICGALLPVARQWDKGPFLLAFGLLYGATFCCAHLSYQYWELPFLRLKSPPSRAAIVAAPLPLTAP